MTSVLDVDVVCSRRLPDAHHPPELFDLLLGDERSRAERMVPDAGLHFAWRRLFLRAVLADRLGIAVDEVLLDRRCRRCGHGSHGKPRLVQGSLTFSLSQRGGATLVAMAQATEIGVDVEECSDRLGFLPDAALAPSELDRLPAEPEARWHFLAVAWAGKEACLKAVGAGLAVDPKAVTGEWQPPGLLASWQPTGAATVEGVRWSTWGAWVTPRHVALIAVPSGRAVAIHERAAPGS